MRHNRLNEQALKDVTWKHLLGYGYGLGVRTHIRPDLSGSLSNIGEFGWGGAAGAYLSLDIESGISIYCAMHLLSSPVQEMRSFLYRFIRAELMDNGDFKLIKEELKNLHNYNLTY